MKQVWKLLVKCFCVLLSLVVLWSYMGRHPLSYIDGEAPYYIWNREKTNTNQEKRYRVIVLGDSVANAAYVPEILSPDTINLALGGTTPAENYHTLRDWLDHNPAPDVCYISFQDFHLQREDCFWTRTMYSHRYRLLQNAELLRSAAAYNEPSILTEHYLLDFISYQLYLPNKYITPFMNAGFNQRYRTNAEAIKADDLHGGRYIARGAGEYNGNGPVTFDEFHVNPMFDAYYRKIIELCIEKGITPRIAKLPLPDNGQFTDAYKKMFGEYYERLQKEYPSVTVDWFPAYPKNRFADAAHMNSHGAVQFSTELKERYPRDFASSDMDAGQISAIDDSVKAENKIEWILKWISGRDYTVLFCDNRGVFPQKYEEVKKEWGTEALSLYEIPVTTAAAADEDVTEETGAKGTAPEGTAPGKTVSEEMVPEGIAPEGTVSADNVPRVWGISGNGKNKFSFSVLSADEGLAIQPSGQEPQPWAISSDDVLGVAVINQYNATVVCMKSFRYAEESFVLEK